MLKSTHRPSTQADAAAPLPEGWTEHKAPTGHSYYYNASTKQSTYTRPANPLPAVRKDISVNAPVLTPSESYLQHQSVGNFEINSRGLPDTFNSRLHLDGGRGGHRGQHGGRSGYEQRGDRRPQPVDKPKSKHAIPGCEPWFIVHTKLGRRFAYNSEKNESYWRIPDKLKDGILALDQQRIKEKAEALTKSTKGLESEGATDTPVMPPSTGTSDPRADHGPEEDSSEYEEVEVTDDEDTEEENASKRQRTEESVPDGPVEFDEDDIAYQLAAMGEEYGLDRGEYDDGHMEDWEEGVEGLELTEEDSVALFKDLLDDSGVNPYSPWEKLVEEGKLVDDTRYTALNTMKSRKEVWEQWSRDRIKQLRDQQAKEEKKDPRIPYMAFLQQKANPKLYWPEFKRKYKKEAEMRDTSLSDKDREKWYREHINRLKLPQATLKSDLLNLLKSQPLSLLNNSTLPSHLPPVILTDARYISVDAKTRDALVESLISTLPPAPQAGLDEEDEDATKQRTGRERRQKALEERERQVAEEKRRQKRSLEFGKGRLREEEAEIARAMNITKRGLKGHLITDEQQQSTDS